MIAATLSSSNSRITLVEMPTGSGKTWVQALLASYYATQNKQVTIVEPNIMLKSMVQDRLGVVIDNLRVMDIESYYKHQIKDDVLIIDEYDSVIEKKPFYSLGKSLTGLWAFSNKVVFMFSATKTRYHKYILQEVFENISEMKFLSEKQVASGNIEEDSCQIICVKKDQKLSVAVADQIEQHKQNSPLIIIFSKENSGDIETLQKQNFGVPSFFASDPYFLESIKEKDKGILFLPEEYGIGVDTKFKVDAIVLLATLVTSETQLYQMIGRGSRSQGQQRGIVFEQLAESQTLFWGRLKRQHNLKLRELSSLLKVIYRRRNNGRLAEIIEDAQLEDDNLSTLKDLESIVGLKMYSSLIQGIDL
ncbi:hypothetical protein OXYTRIMIC_115 [Oxytricha trifallax]|uniref:Helicase/UvrB N-terminal domain-containing protein n=1 Tax=Oxytricha trifallax TaxID=1172189 RepID=A0A073HWN7_9SPIT|nr:hypothetical protein OXYTRIMIC_115 [Oxytricha trifallax]